MTDSDGRGEEAGLPGKHFDRREEKRGEVKRGEEETLGRKMILVQISH